MKSVITVTQIDGARVQVNSQNIEAIIEVLPESTTAYVSKSNLFDSYDIRAYYPR